MEKITIINFIKMAKETKTFIIVVINYYLVLNLNYLKIIVAIMTIYYYTLAFFITQKVFANSLYLH